MALLSSLLCLAVRVEELHCCYDLADAAIELHCLDPLISESSYYIAHCLNLFLSSTTSKPSRPMASWSGFCSRLFQALCLSCFSDYFSKMYETCSLSTLTRSCLHSAALLA